MAEQLWDILSLYKPEWPSIYIRILKQYIMKCKGYSTIACTPRLRKMTIRWTSPHGWQIVWRTSFNKKNKSFSNNIKKNLYRDLQDSDIALATCLYIYFNVAYSLPRWKWLSPNKIHWKYKSPTTSLSCKSK